MRFILAFLAAFLFAVVPGRALKEPGRSNTTLILPCFAFERNSTKLITCSNGYKVSHPDSTLLYLKTFLTDNPTIVIKITATAYDEKHMRHLSRQRAKAIKKRLVSTGIPARRIVAKGAGDSEPLIHSDIINKAETEDEKETLKGENRRAYFTILSFNYGVRPGEKKAKKQNQKDEDE